MTKKKLIVGALSLMAAMLFATPASFGQCGSGVNVHYVGIGSSAEFQTLAFGANKALAALGGYTAPTNIWSSTAAQVIDTRPSVIAGFTNTIDTGLKIWVFYDSSATCNAYVGYQADSVQGTKDFYCYKKVPAGFVGTEAACYGNSTGVGSWELANSGANVVLGLPDTPAATPLPAAISTFLVSGPVPTKTGKVQNLPPAYCGQLGSTTHKAVAATAYCYFNSAHTDIRPEDGLYATTRALSSYSTTNGLAGLGYNQTACGAQVSGTHVVGCPIFDSFQKKAVFYPLQFALKTSDSYTKAVIPGSTTLSLGATPVVVFVNNADSSNSLGFGVKQGDGSYLHKDINHKVLAHVFEGTDPCTGDLLPTTPTPALYGGLISGSGQPIQAVVREPLSGTYNTFEFTAVRTLSGSAATAVGQNNITTVTWISDDESSQEFDPYAQLGTTAGADGPAFAFNTPPACPGNSTAAPTGTCGDPLYNPGGLCSGSTSGVGSGRLRAIGTGEEVAATLGLDNVASTAAVVEDGIGYAFWGYSNFKPGASGCQTASTASPISGDVTCANYIGHYLTVDAVDPLFETEGGERDATPNPNGAYNFPQCAFIQDGVSKGGAFPCEQIPFYHIYDGKYPLWSLLRLVSFNNINPTATVNGQQTPEGVINVLSYAESEAAPGSAEQLSDFVPFFNTIAGVPYTQGGAFPTGNLNLGVFRSHYLQSVVNPYNGHTACGGNFVGVKIVGGSGTGATCLVDTGGDVGGSVLTVQSDVDFNLDFGGQIVNGVHYPAEIYGLHQ